jgi:ankyrin repeat protein
LNYHFPHRRSNGSLFSAILVVSTIAILYQMTFFETHDTPWYLQVGMSICWHGLLAVSAFLPDRCARTKSRSSELDLISSKSLQPASLQHTKPSVVPKWVPLSTPTPRSPEELRDDEAINEPDPFEFVFAISPIHLPLDSHNEKKAITISMAETEPLFESDKTDVESKGMLIMATFQKAHAVVKMLLDKDEIDVDSRDNTDRTALSWASQIGDSEILRLLIKTGKADVNSADYKFRTPLSWASREGNYEVVKILLDTGKADVDFSDSDGRTPLSWSSQGGHEVVSKLLIEVGKADVDSKDSLEGWTPLSWAAQSGRIAVVTYLLANGVNLNSEDRGGRTPLSLAMERKEMVVVKLLLDAGAHPNPGHKIVRKRMSWPKEGLPIPTKRAPKGELIPIKRAPKRASIPTRRWTRLPKNGQEVPSESSDDIHPSNEDEAENRISDNLGMDVPDAAVEWRKRMVDRIMDHLGELFGDTSSSQTRGGPSQSGGRQSSGGDTYDRQQRNVPKRQWDNAFSNDSSDVEGNDEGDGEKRQPRGSKLTDNEEPLNKRLACPFFQHDPRKGCKGRSCAGPGWPAVHRIK